MSPDSLMTDLARALVREPSTNTPRQFSRRVERLAAIYTILFLASIAGVGVLVWRGRFFIALTQRSNVETLTLVFFLVFFSYIAILSGRGAFGAATLLYLRAQRWIGVDRAAVERRKMQLLGKPAEGGAGPTVALNRLIERADRPGEPFTLRIADTIGSMGVLVIDGARAQHHEAYRNGSNDLFAYLCHQIGEITAARGARRPLNIVAWKKIDDEAVEEYLALAEFGRNLGKHLGAGELWPRLTLTEADCAELERRLAEVCPALREEGLLPQWEFSGEHKIPIIPEPLGIITLSRTERRVDPVASMGAAAVVVVGVLFLLVFFLLRPPWVPGA